MGVGENSEYLKSGRHLAVFLVILANKRAAVFYRI